MSFEDFNCLPDIITDEIFKYFTFDDICNILQVSKKWHDYVGRNSLCMNKLRLKIEGWHDLEIITNILLQNSRSYSAIVLHNLNSTKEFDYLLSKNWKDVRLQQMKFASSTKFCEYLAQFGEFVEVLEIEKIIISSNDTASKDFLILPHLRELRLKQVPTTAFPIFPRYSNLKLLYFDIPAFGTQSRSLIVNFFEKFHTGNIETLTIRRNSLYGLSLEDIASMESIIISLSGSLKKLELLDWGYCHTFEKLWNQLQVGHFSFNFCSHCPKIEDMRGLVPNNNLKILELTQLNVPVIDWFKKLFLLTPFLEYLFIKKIRKEIVYHAAHFLQNLKIFDYVSCAIDVAKTEFNASEEDDVEIFEIEDKDPGKDYDYIGKSEIFDLDGSATRPLVIERYFDHKLKKSFANLYYSNIRDMPSINPNIKIRKCDKSIGFNGF